MEKTLWVNGEQIIMVIPPGSYHGLTIRLRGLGAEPVVDPLAPPLDHKVNGNLLVKLFVYPDKVFPRYIAFDHLTTEEMFLEGWVYRKFDELMRELDRASLPRQPMQAESIADHFNDRGAWGIFKALVEYMNLASLKIDFTHSASLPNPGAIQATTVSRNNLGTTNYYRITIKDQFLDNPFLVAAILAHELCHVIFAEKIDHEMRSFGIGDRSEKTVLEIERTIDLLVCIFTLGEFQLRVARDARLTLGYFNQDLFERIQVIVSRKLSS